MTTTLPESLTPLDELDALNLPLLESQLVREGPYGQIHRTAAIPFLHCKQEEDKTPEADYAARTMLIKILERGQPPAGTKLQHLLRCLPPDELAELHDAILTPEQKEAIGSQVDALEHLRQEHAADQPKELNGRKAGDTWPNPPETSESDALQFSEEEAEHIARRAHSRIAVRR